MSSNRQDEWWSHVKHWTHTPGMQRHVYRRVVHNRLSLHGGSRALCAARSLHRSLPSCARLVVRPAQRATIRAPAPPAPAPSACSPRACSPRTRSRSPARPLVARPLVARPLARLSRARLAAVELLMDGRGGWGGGGDLRWLLAGGAAKVEDSRCAAAQLAPLAGLRSAPPRCSTARRCSGSEKLFQVRSTGKFRHGDGLRRPCPQHRPRQPWPARAGKSWQVAPEAEPAPALRLI